MMKEKRFSFKGKVIRDAHKSTRVSRGYLNLPEGVKAYSIEENAKKVLLDILPYTVTDPHHPLRDVDNGIALVGDPWYRRPIKVHRDVGAEKESFICPKSVGKPCPICDYQKKRFNEGAKKEETKELYPKDRNLYVVVPIDQPKWDEEPCVWDMAQSLFQDCLKEELDLDPENEIFPSLEEGKTLEISLKWKTLGNNPFPEARSIKFLDREPYDEKILERIPNLDTILKVLSYDELSAKFFDVDIVSTDEDEKEWNEEEIDNRHTQIMAARKPSSLARHDKPAPEDDEDEDEDTPPQRTFRKAPVADLPPRRKPVEEPEDDEPAPRSRTRKEETSKEKDRCPYGHKFGVDTDQFDDCEKCELWDACYEALNSNKR